ncbi:MAG: penicillin-binding protein 2 [Azospirillum sp.]|nr:penicillin-binding protein 2 [Azospirillum sp.]
MTGRGTDEIVADLGSQSRRGGAVLEHGGMTRPTAPLRDVVGHALEQAHNRLMVTAAVLSLAFGVIAIRVADVTLLGPNVDTHAALAAAGTPQGGRADIIDRNGALLATSLATASLYADPKLIIDPKAATRKLVKALPELNHDEVLAKLSSEKRFVWLKRNLTPRQHYAVHVLGLPGLFFQNEERRFYPSGSLTSHVVGFTGVDNNGLAGLEQSFDKKLKASSTPLQTSIDLRLQHILRREVQAQVDEFKGIGAAGLIYDVNTGEVLAMVSLPDFDPHEPAGLDKDTLFNRVTLGVYEMGSTFKIFNSAMSLDTGRIRLSDAFDATHAIHVGRFTISDYHGKNRWLTVPEIFMYSSNIGSVRMALQIGTATQKQFMAKMGFLQPVPVEIPEAAWPLVPHPWRDINTMTIAFGHGISVSALHLVVASASVLNGGIMVKPTLLKRQPGVPIQGERVVSERTSEQMRKLFRLVVTDGTAKFADVPGYLVGGKTGTADKQRGRHYAQNARLSSFIGAFPMNAPRYIVFVMVDEPKPSAATHGYATGGWVAAPAVGRLVRQIGPLLGVEPVDENRPEIRQAMAIEHLNRGPALAAYQPDARQE